jgi:hypothetical protein
MVPVYEEQRFIKESETFTIKNWLLRMWWSGSLYEKSMLAGLSFS